MMEKAGYLQRTGYSAFDGEGNVHAVIEIHILGSRYAIRRSDLSKAVSGHVFVQLEELTHQWQYYLGAVKGLAQVSASGKALNIELFEAGNFTVSLNSLCGVMYGKERLATIVRIPTHSDIGTRRVVCGQQQISAAV
jgi:hypothetical protein